MQNLVDLATGGRAGSPPPLRPTATFMTGIFGEIVELGDAVVIEVNR